MSALDGIVKTNISIYDLPFRHQSFSLPDSIVYYLTKNPTTSKLYERLVQSCKYFYAKNPILLIDILHVDGTAKFLCYLKNYKKENEIHINKFKCWINGSLSIFSFNKPNIASNLIPTIYRCDATYLNLIDQNLLFNEFLFLSSSAQTFSFNNVKIQYPNGEEIFLEDIIKNLTKLQRFYSFSKPHISFDTVKNLLNIPYFSRLYDFNLRNLDETFDIQTFYSYFIKNKFTKIGLCFGNSISEEFKYKLKDIVEEIIKTKYLTYQPPLITYPQMSFQKHRDIIAASRKKPLLK